MSGKPDSRAESTPEKFVNLTIDGKPVTVPEGTTILEAAKTVNVTIPVLCDHPDLCKRAFCRICVVECDGRGKLAAACANDVWEGVNIVTVNKRLVSIRKTIIEMIIANHPLDCLKCVRNQKCELQALAAKYGIVSSGFENEAGNNPPVTEGDTIVRDIDKCVKCWRCVEVCQEVQNIRALNTSYRGHEFEISTAYKQSMENVCCVFCGQCANVCPVGAIYEYDQSEAVWNALNSTSMSSIAQVSASFAPALEKELSLTAGIVTAGKIVQALKSLGFDKVYDAAVAANISDLGICSEVKQRKDNSGYSLPVISGCSSGVTRFIRNFFHDLESHLSIGKNPRKLFAADIKNNYAKEAGINASDVTSVSLVPCLAQKYAVKPDKNDFTLTAAEFAKMIKLAGIMIENFHEEKFDSSLFDSSKGRGIDPSVKKITITGYAQARVILEAVQKGECDADWIEIESCPAGNCSFSPLPAIVAP